jgi:hypothetical protein
MVNDFRSDADQGGLDAHTHSGLRPPLLWSTGYLGGVVNVSVHLFLA